MENDYTQLLKIICIAAFFAFALNLVLTLAKQGLFTELMYAMANP